MYFQELMAAVQNTLSHPLRPESKESGLLRLSYNHFILELEVRSRIVTVGDKCVIAYMVVTMVK